MDSCSREQQLAAAPEKPQQQQAGVSEREPERENAWSLNGCSGAQGPGAPEQPDWTPPLST